MMMDKKALPKWKQNHDLHVLLIIKAELVSKSQATVQAYSEGFEGLNKRLGQGDLLAGNPEPKK